MDRKIPIHISFYNDRWEKMISDGMHALGWEPVFLHGEVQLSDIQDSELLFGMFPPALLAQCPRLKWLQCSFAGVDTYTAPGVFVRPDAILTNASGAYGITISEHMICVLLMMMRRMPEYQALIAQRGWRILGDIRSIYGSTVTIVGMGDIGSNFGRRLKAMGATVRGVRRTVREKPDWADQVFPAERLNEALAGADVVALCLPGTEGTRSILGQAQFDAMAPGTYVINVGRGTAIDQQALDCMRATGCVPLVKISFDGIGYHDWMRAHKGAEETALRAIRLCLTRPILFQTQLCAILRASRYGNVGIMFPMVTGPDELHRLKEALADAEDVLIARGKRFGPYRVGVMIETPAAVFMSGELAGEVDFFSIGTNDLTQYLLAMDRQNPNLAPFCDPHHPAVLRAIRQTVERAHQAGCTVGICGELAADEALTEAFLRLGVDELSVAPSRILPLREKIRSLTLG